MNKIGILGGTFDPIHNGHIELALCAYKNLFLEKVLFIPTNIPPHKIKKSTTSTYDRLYMCKLATKNYSQFEVSSIEIDRAGVSYTIDTLRELKNIYVDSQLYFIVGSDMFLSYEIFKDYKEIFKVCTLCVAVRNDDNIEDLISCKEFLHNNFGCQAKILNMNKMAISSTIIRDNIKNNKSIHGLVPKCVEDYILKNNLYGAR